jgi:hypothetical protein
MSDKMIEVIGGTASFEERVVSLCESVMSVLVMVIPGRVEARGEGRRAVLTVAHEVAAIKVSKEKAKAAADVVGKGVAAAVGAALADREKAGKGKMKIGEQRTCVVCEARKGATGFRSGSEVCRMCERTGSAGGAV